MSNGKKPCPICTLDAGIQKVGNRDAFEIECQRCGRFVVTRQLLDAMEKLNADDQHLLPYLSAHTRQTTEQGILVELNRNNWRDLARAHTTTPVSQKVNKLLELIAARSSHPGDPVQIDTAFDYPLLDASMASEVNYLLEHLKGLGYFSWPLLHEADGRFVELPKSNERITKGRLTVKGWERLEPPSGRGGIPGRCFIAMSFDPSLNDAYEIGIRPAVTECGFDPVRIDRVHHNEKICDKILAEIRLSQFVVADFTLQRAGVYFEAGFGMGLGRPVIWVCRDNDFENTHFDTRQYNHIVWSTPNDLRAKLVDRIRATVPR